MIPRILLVDDEQALINGVMRRLDDDWHVFSVTSGKDALVAVAEHGPFAVVVTDLRMPTMDGLEFIQRARPLTSDTCFVILTGNQNPETLVRAINETQIFRVLSKPCEWRVLKETIQDGIRHFQRVQQERERGHQLLIEVVSCLADFSERGRPELIGRSARTERLVTDLLDAAGQESRWEVRAAARLAFLGFALRPEAELGEFLAAAAGSPAWYEALERATTATRRRFERVSMMAPVLDVLQQASAPEGLLAADTGATAGAIAPLGAAALATALTWETIQSLPAPSATAVQERLSRWPGLPSPWRQLLGGLDGPGPAQDGMSAERSDSIAAALADAS